MRKGLTTYVISDFKEGKVSEGRIFVDVTPQIRKDSYGNTYIDLEVKDHTGMGYVKVWHNSIYFNELFQRANESSKEMIRVRMNGLYNNLVLFELLEIEMLQDNTKVNEQETASVGETALDKVILSLKDESLKAILLTLFSDKTFKSKYNSYPLSYFKTNGYSKSNGIFDFTINLVRLIYENQGLLKREGIDLEYMVFLAIIEPIGRIESIVPRPMSSNNYKSEKGKLVPHTIHTFNKVMPIALRYMSEDGWLYTQSVLLSVPGKEWGALREPATKEADVFNRLWQIVMQLGHYEQQKDFTKRDFASIFKKEVYLKTYHDYK